tara:strand:+ start:2237 stop:2926 length:690 start_codon:yes stop_codon:yes gene_type:complete
MDMNELVEMADRQAKQREEQLQYPPKDYSKGKVTLYHGTSTKYLDDILSKGITPRHNKDSNWSDNPSHPLMVYLSDAYPVYFAQQSVEVEGDDEPVVLEVIVDTKRLYPDEDYLEQFTRIDPKWVEVEEQFGYNMSMEDRTKWFKTNLTDYKEHYVGSLFGLGNCCHKGLIKPKNIVRYSILDYDQILHYSDPTITLQNYQILGGKYRMISAKTMWEKPLSKESINLQE